MFDISGVVYLFFDKKKYRIGDYTAKLTFLWYNKFGEKERSLHRNGMAAIPKTYLVIAAY